MTATLEQRCKRIKKRVDAGAVVIKGAMRSARDLAEEAGASQTVKDELASKEQAVIDAIDEWCEAAKNAAGGGGVVIQSGGGDKDEEED